jgi:hypothetical protein
MKVEAKKMPHNIVGNLGKVVIQGKENRLLSEVEMVNIILAANRLITNS